MNDADVSPRATNSKPATRGGSAGFGRSVSSGAMMTTSGDPPLSGSGSTGYGDSSLEGEDSITTADSTVELVAEGENATESAA